MASDQTTPMRVLIAGAGIAGPAFAFWMNRLGHSCTVIERFPNLRTNGQQVDIRKEGVEVAARMGLLDHIRNHVVDELGLQFVNTAGEQQAWFPKLETGSGEQGFTSEFEIMRGDLCRILADSTRDDTEYRFGLSVDGFENKGDRVQVRFSNGSVEEYDMLVAADGQGSRIRKSLLQDESGSQDCSQNLGVYTAYYTMRRSLQDQNLATVYNASDRRVLFSRWHNEAQGQGYLVTMSHAEEMEKVLEQGTAEQKDLFSRIFKDAGWQAERLVGEMLNADDFYAQSAVQIKSKIWSKGRVVLLGDAGYGPTPLTGMGTSLALIGAYVLAGEISKSKGNFGEAFEAYEKTLRPYVDLAQKLPPGLPSLVYPKTELGVKGLQWFLSLTSTLRIDRLFQTSFFTSKDSWTLPNYEALEK